MEELDLLSEFNLLKDVSHPNVIRLLGACTQDGMTCDKNMSILIHNNVFQPFPKQALVFTCLQYKSFKNTVGKGEIACNEQFLLLPQCFLPIWRTFYQFHQI